jgi:hypothetical protein
VATETGRGAAVAALVIAVSSWNHPAFSATPAPGDEEVWRDLERMASDEPQRYEAVITTMQTFLARFGYGVSFTGSLDVQTRKAIGAYRRRADLSARTSPTPPGLGELEAKYPAAAATAEAMFRDDEAMEPPRLRGGSFSFMDSGSLVHATGEWLPEGAGPNSVELTCHVREGYCEEVGALADAVAASSPADDLLVAPTVQAVAAYQHRYTITSANGAEIVAPLDGDRACGGWTLRIDRRARRITSSWTPPTTAKPCNYPIATVTLGDGTEVWNAREKRASEASRRILLRLRPRPRPGP